MRAADLIRLLQQYDANTDIHVDFQNNQPSIQTCDETERSRCYESLVEKAEDGLLVINPQGYITYANPFLCLMADYDSVDLAGQPLSLLIADDDAELVRERLAMTVESPHHRRFTVRLRTRRQQYRWVQLSLTPVLGEDGACRGCMITMTDLSLQSAFLTPQSSEPLNDKVEWIYDQLNRLRVLRSALLVELQQLQEQSRITATPFWHQGRYLYLNQPQVDGQRKRQYIGSQPEKIKAALAAIRNQQRYDDIQQELANIDGHIRTATFRLDSFLLELAKLPPTQSVATAILRSA